MRQKFQPPWERALQGDPWGGHLLLHHLDNDDDGDDDDAKDDGNSEDNGDDDEDDDDHEDDRDDDRTKSSSPHKIHFLSMKPWLGDGALHVVDANVRRRRKHIIFF